MLSKLPYNALTMYLIILISCSSNFMPIPNNSTLAILAIAIASVYNRVKKIVVSFECPKKNGVIFLEYS